MPRTQKFKRNAAALLVVMAVLVSCVAAATTTTTTTLEKRQREQDRFRSSVDILSRQEPFWGVSFRSATSDLASASSFDTASSTAAPTALTTIIDTTTTTLLDVADSLAGSFLLPDSKDIHISHGIEPDCEIFFLDAKEEAGATMTANAEEGGDLPKRPERFLITYASMSEERAHKHTGKKEVAWGPELLQGRDTIIRGPVLFLRANIGDNENDREGNDGNNKAGKHVVQFEVPYAKGTVIVVYTVYTSRGQEDAPIGQAVKETISIPPFTVKVSFVVRSWEFEPEPFGEEGEYERRLKATMILYSVDATGNSTLLPSSSPFEEGEAEEGDQANEDEIADNNAIFSLGPNSPFSLRSRFLSVAEVDGSLRPVSIDTKLVSRHSAKIPGLPGRGIEVTMTFPHFNDILIYDPDFSVLFPGGQQEDGDDNNGDGANVEDDDKAVDNAEDFCCESAGFYGLISALVLVAVAVVVVSMLVAVLVHRRKNQRFKEKYPLRSAGAVQIQIDSESSASSTPTSTMRSSSLASFRNLSDTAFAPA